LERQVHRKKKICYYKVLGIQVAATQEQIRSAFRYLAKKWHPDKNPGNSRAAERFREVLVAYETLINPAMRSRYDRNNGHRGARRKPEPYWTDLHSDEKGGEAASFEEIFQDVFGFGRPKVRTQRGCDLRFDVQVARNSLGGGRQEEISYERLVFCRNCNGKGVSRAGCPRCGGTGEHEEVCTLRIWIPEGILDGTRIRIPGGGDSPSAGFPPGDLVLLVNVIENC